jgi:hypothetical protein
LPALSRRKLKALPPEARPLLGMVILGDFLLRFCFF